MVSYWASKTFIPNAAPEQESLPGYKQLTDLKSAVRGLSVEQHQIVLEGAAEMLGALQYHFMRFVEITNKKGSGELPSGCPDERFEAVAYVSRLGQFWYFAASPCALELSEANSPADLESLLPTLCRLLPFRHKYAAHRSIDQPRPKDLGMEISGELALGTIGGSFFVAKTVQEPNTPADLGPVGNGQIYKRYYAAYQYFGPACHIEFVPELDHPIVMSECSSFLQCAINKAKQLPRS